MDSSENGMGQGLVKFEAVARQNAILVVTAKPDLLKRRQLDRPAQFARQGGTASRSIRSATARPSRSPQLLDQIFGSGKGASADTAANSLAPGGGAKAMSVAERLTGRRRQARRGRAAGGRAAARATAPRRSSSAACRPAARAELASTGAWRPAARRAQRAASPPTRSTTPCSSTPGRKLQDHRAYAEPARPAQAAGRHRCDDRRSHAQRHLNYGVQFFLDNKGGGLAIR